MKKFFPIYPILLGVIWVLITYSSNRELLPSIGVVVVPMLVVTGILTVIWGITQLIVRDWRKSALAVAVVFLLSISHGYVRDYTNVAGGMMSLIWLALVIDGVFMTIKYTRPKGRLHLTVISNVVCLAMLFVCSLGVVAGGTTTSRPEIGYDPVLIKKIGNPTPDIYYLIPDTYTSKYVLETYLDYDNETFYNFLQERDFYTYPHSKANYHHSILSISSVLNMRYWTDEELGDSLSQVLGKHLLQNPVGDTVKEAGYTYVHIGSWWGFTSQNIQADIIPQYSILKELPFTLYKTVLWYDLASLLFDKGGDSILREAHLGQFENLVEVSKMEESTFTFCHFILPHPPFLFEADGSHTSGWALLPAEDWQRKYLAQLEFTTLKLMETIDEILLNSEVTPIIIISADEGYGGPDWQEYWEENEGLVTLMEDRPDLAAKRHGNLYAILNPYGDGLPVPTSPVNTFRYVFNSLFDSQLEYLPDKYYLRSVERYENEFVDVTERFRDYEAD